MVVYRIGPCVHWSFELYMLALVAAIVGNSLSFYTAFFFITIIYLYISYWKSMLGNPAVQIL